MHVYPAQVGTRDESTDLLSMLARYNIAQGGGEREREREGEREREEEREKRESTALVSMLARCNIAHMSVLPSL